MTQAEKNKKIDAIVNQLGKMMLYTPFTTEFQVKKNPKGIRIIFEVSQEEMDIIAQHQK